MSFEIGGMSNHNNRVEGAMPSRDGGGGNTGYFQSGRQEHHEEHKEESGHDLLELSNAKNEEDEISVSFKDFKILKMITEFFEKLFNQLRLIFIFKTDSTNKLKEADIFKKSDIESTKKF